MARYEKLGFCPHNSFADADLFPNKAMILGVLGNRTADMYYPEDDKAWSDDVSIVSAMLGGDGTLGMQLACFLRFCSPISNLEIGKPIRIHDVLNPKHISKDLYCEDPEHCQGWSFFVDGKAIKDSPVTWKEGLFLFEDDSYLVAAKDDLANDPHVDIWIFQKPITMPLPDPTKVE